MAGIVLPGSCILSETNQIIIDLKLQFLLSIFSDAKLKQMNLQEPEYLSNLFLDYDRHKIFKFCQVR